MITCDATTLGVVEISASQDATSVCPTFTMTVKPQLGTGQPLSTHLAWTPPSTVVFTIDDLSWECVPLDTTIRDTPGEVAYLVSYYPKLIHILRRAKLKKPTVWISAPSWEQSVYLKDFDTDTYEVFVRNSDAYASNGWDIAGIFSTLSSITGYTITANFPTCHLAQKTIMCDEQTALLDFIGSLLPSGFRYVWTTTTKGVAIALLSPPPDADLAFPANSFSVECHTPPVEAYDSIAVTGAPYKLESGLSLPGLTSVSAKASYTETLPAETGVLNGKPTRTVRRRVVQPDPYNVPFAIPTEYESCYVSGALHRYTTTTASYENQDAMIYETPRVTKTVREVSGYAITAVQAAVVNNSAAFLTSKLQILNLSEYQAISADKRPSILLAAYLQWEDSVETTTDEKTYTSTSAASKTWPEGTELSNIQTSTNKGYQINSRFFKRTQSVSSFLQEVAAMLQQTGVTAISSFSSTTKTVDRVSRTLRLQGAGAYRFEEIRQTLDASTGQLQTTAAMLPVNNDPPSSPTRWRTTPLTAVIDHSSASGALVYRAPGSVPTSNPSDFETWVTRLFIDMTQARTAYTITTPSILPVGAYLGGYMTTGWSCSQRGHVYSASLTIE